MNIICIEIQILHVLMQIISDGCFYIIFQILFYLEVVAPFKILHISSRKGENERKKHINFNIFNIGCKIPKQWENFVYFKNILLIFIIYSNYKSGLKLFTILFIMMISQIYLKSFQEKQLYLYI